MDVESLVDSDSEEADRELEALVGPWKGIGAAQKRPREVVDEEEGEPSEKAVAVEPEVEAKLWSKTGRGADAERGRRLPSTQSRPQTADEELRERSPILSHIDYALSRDELIDRARSAVSSIMSETQKSGNLKGGVRGEINRATKIIYSAMDSLQAMTADEEARRLRADNRRMRQEMAVLRAEVKALRTSFSAREKSPAPMRQPDLDVDPQASPALGEMLETLKRDLFVSIGGMVNERLKQLEKRLPQEPILRPPLAADKKRGKVDHRPTDEPSAGPSPARPATTQPTGRPKRSKATKPAPAPQAEGSAPLRKEAPHETETARTTAPTPPAWSEVVGRKAKAKSKKAAGRKATVPAHAPAKSPPATRKGKLTSPKSSAVVITLRPEAVATQSYATVMKAATSGFALSEVGVNHVRVRKSATGARIIEVPGAGSAKAADELAGKLQGLVGEWVTVSRPMKTAELRLVGLDESVTPEEVQRVAAEKGNVPPEQVRVGAIRMGPSGTGSSLVRCPVPAAKLLIAAGRCGKDGHKAASCSADPKCAVCTQLGRKAGHVMGGLKCSPPPTKGKEAPLTRAPDTGNGQQETEPEDIEMDA
ncbi:transcriptional regulatory protein AlgP-like [Pararge aegeria]|uniref:transcriptional regulatory protein AlgP-like n=1 Tax=Pararge aegeria TaxID=116150 RepID=UPI0019D10CC4|nr:transcriptional regulatory protein AlgP-like [Pararge aegeria]